MIYLSILAVVQLVLILIAVNQWTRWEDWASYYKGKCQLYEAASQQNLDAEKIEAE